MAALLPVIPPAQAEFLTVEEAATLLRIGRNQMYQAIARGEVRGVKRIGKTIRVRRSALLADDPEPA